MSGFLRGGLSDLIQGMSSVEKKAFIAQRKALATSARERQKSGVLRSGYTSFNQSADVFSAEQRRLQQVENLLDSPSRLPDQTVQSTIFNSTHIMGAPPPSKPLATAGPDDIVLGAGGGALESLERQAASPASLLSDAEALMGLKPALPRRRHPVGANPFTDPPLPPPPTPSGPVPTNLNIANMLSQLTPKDMAKIHRGNVAASHPGASTELIDRSC